MPAHSQVKVTVIIDLLDRWNGYDLNLKIDGVAVEQISYNWCPRTFKNICVT